MDSDESKSIVSPQCGFVILVEEFVSSIKKKLHKPDLGLQHLNLGEQRHELALFETTLLHSLVIDQRERGRHYFNNRKMIKYMGEEKLYGKENAP